MNLFLELRRHGRLADKRHPMYEKSRFARFWMYFVAVFWAGYLIFIGTMLAFGSASKMPRWSRTISSTRAWSSSSRWTS